MFSVNPCGFPRIVTESIMGGHVENGSQGQPCVFKPSKYDCDQDMTANRTDIEMIVLFC